MADVEFIMECVGPGTDESDFALWACRGKGRGCTRNGFRDKKLHCADCVPADDPNETLEHFRARLQRGDA
jgi:hypothetical protein